VNTVSRRLGISTLIAAKKIDQLIAKATDWRGERLAEIRARCRRAKAHARRCCERLLDLHGDPLGRPR
jgi:hypothetical protein